MPSLGGVRYLSGLSHRCDLPVRFYAPSCLCGGGDLSGLYSALPQGSKLVVGGLCFGKVGGVISCMVCPVRGYRQKGPQCPPTHPCLSLQYLCCNSLCAWGLGSVCYIWCNSPALSRVLCEIKYAPSNSLSLPPLPGDLSPGIMPQDYLA
jgi:hypothetical protein